MDEQTSKESPSTNNTKSRDVIDHISPCITPPPCQSEANELQSPENRRRVQRKLLKWLRRLPCFSPSLVLENSGSVARDHLAAERTFLAYVRTSLGCAAAGVTLVQLISLSPTNIPFRLHRFGQYLGAAIELLGVAILVIAVSRYFNMQKALIEGKYEPAGTVIWAMSFVMAAIILVMFGLVLGISLS